ncbi:MAG: hypothetical protein PHD37_06585 [Gallionellaceae bacterium]|nr:hypothetical protein [Gallionellaceae bacterium]
MHKKYCTHKTLRPLLTAFLVAGLLTSMSTGAADVADVNPFTGTEASIAGLKRQLEVARLKAQIATEEANIRRIAKEEKAPVDLKNPLAQFGTLNFPTEKMPLFDTFGKPKGKGAKPESAPAVVTPAPAPSAAPVIPVGPRLVGILRDEAGRVAIIEQGGVLKQVKEGESAHGQKVTKIGDGWAEVGGKRLTQDNSSLALVTNVDKQPVARVVAGGVNTSPAASGQPVAQATPFMPPNFQ